MNKALPIALLAAALAAGLAPLAGCGRSSDSEPTLIEAPSPDEVRLVCVHCDEPFLQSEGRPLHGRQDMVVCPHCGEQTTIRRRAGEP